MTFDPALQGPLLFGGALRERPTNICNDTWEFSASGWTQLHPATSPPSQNGQLVHDAADGYAFLWGTAGANHFEDDRVFENGDWTTTTSSVTGAPPSESSFATYDPPTKTG